MSAHDKLPPCPCGTTQPREPGGGSMGGHGSTHWYTCRCGRAGVVITNYMGVFVAQAEPAPKFPAEGLDWINGPLDVVMRSYGARVEAIRKVADREHWEMTFDFLGLPRDTKVAHDHEPKPYARFLRKPDGTEVRDELVIARFDAAGDAQRHLNGKAVLAPPMGLPRLPACVSAYVWRNDAWVWADPEGAAALSVPPDPRRERHNVEWKRIFSRLAALGIQADGVNGVREVPNGYYDDRLKAEPWYEFNVGDCHVRVGPRKRVISLEVTWMALNGNSAKPPAQAVAEIIKLAHADKVTFDAQWRNGTDPGGDFRVLIHAWTEDKLIEYVSTLLGPRTPWSRPLQPGEAAP